MTPKENNQLELTVAEDSTLPHLFETSEKSSLLDHLIVLARHKTFIFFFTVTVGAVTAALSLFMTTYYQATLKMMPPQQNQSFASAMLDQLGSLAPLLGAAGGKDLLKNPSDLYVAMLRSRTVSDRIIDDFSLMAHYKSKMREDARKRLAGLSEISAGKDGLIAVAVEDSDRELSAKIANQYVQELETLTKTLAVTDAQKRRRFFETESQAAQEQLETAEDNMAKVQKETGYVQVDNQARIMFQAFGDLKAQLYEKELEIQDLKNSFAAPDNPELIRLQHEQSALQEKLDTMIKGEGGSPIGEIALGKAPDKAKKYIDSAREVAYRSALMQLMLKQYQAARVDEAKDFAMIQVLDPAIPPERKSRPHRGIICIAFAFLAFLTACLWVFFREAVQHAKEDPHYLARLQLLKYYLWGERRTQAGMRSK